jgi:hypothetical protein
MHRRRLEEAQVTIIAGAVAEAVVEVAKEAAKVAVKEEKAATGVAPIDMSRRLERPVRREMLYICSRLLERA